MCRPKNRVKDDYRKFIQVQRGTKKSQKLYNMLPSFFSG